MKKRVNLFSPSDLDAKIRNIMGDLKKRGLALLIVFFIVLIAEGGGYMYFSKNISSSQELLASMNQFIANNNNFDKKVRYFIFKYNLLKEFLKEDAHSYLYYNLFRNLILSTPASIETFEIDNTRTAKITLHFASYEHLSEFIAFIENVEFLDKFEYVILEEFTLSNNDSQENRLKINLECKFKEIYGQ